MGLFSGGGIYVFTLDGRSVSTAVRQVETKVARMSDNPELKDLILLEAADIVDPYVPAETGRLSRSVTLQDGKLVYSAIDPDNKRQFDYAEVQYAFQGFSHATSMHPLARDHWFDVLQKGGECRDEFIARAAEILANAWSKEA